MASISTGAALMYSALITAAATGASAAAQGYQAHKATHEQKTARQNAEAEQKKAEAEAEEKRLQGLADAATTTDAGNIWGTGANKNYADAAQKLSAGTGSFSDDEEDNPFYSRGLA